ncbi:MAG: hypothetical protein PCFJNLEI_03153 [Verrucomicrobiae bacterium]|nr:hypothetical protein [Verrucomicrobiae bacterium]
MKIDLNDPKLTAYALGELSAADRQTFETALAEDPAARQEVERIQLAAGMLKERLDSEPCPRLEPAQRNVIYEKLTPAETPVGFRWWAGALAGVAALVLIAGLMLPALNTSRGKARQLQVYSQANERFALTAPPKGERPALDQVDDALNTTPAPVAAPAVEEPVILPTPVMSPPPSDKEIKVIRGTATVFDSKLSSSGGLHAETVQLRATSAYSNPTFQDGSGPRGQFGSEGGLRNATLSKAPMSGPPGSAGGDMDIASARKPSGSGGGLYRPENESRVVRQVPFRRESEFATVKESPGTESYAPVYDNPFYVVTDQPLSTFGLDVDTASYSNIRRFLLNNQLPPRDAVRIEEMLNYFSYDYPAPRGREPFSLYVEMGECPWNPAHQLALVGLKAKDITAREQPPLNLVFLIDVSGSMQPANKLPLIKQALRLLVPQLSARDRVSIVVYANNARVALPSTRGDQHRRILSVIDELNADGGTNGGEGIQNAYAQASENFIKGGVNRVILCTDGDFNVGITDQSDLTRLIKDKAASGIFLSVFGFGMGNLKDSTMQKLANNGNGHYAYIDDLDEARKVLVDQARSTIITVAKDVKLQVEFNPAQVQAYRLIGYEKRALAARDFNDDRKDAGDIGAGHTVTALYEIVPAGEAVGEPGVDALKYQPAKNRPAVNGEWATVKFRYKNPDADKSQLLTAALKNSGLRWRTASDDFQFAAAVATFGMVLRDSPQKSESNLNLAFELATAGRGRDANGYRSEFADLVKRAGELSR